MKLRLILIAALGFLLAPAGALTIDSGWEEREAAQEAYRSSFSQYMDKVKDKASADAAAVKLNKLQQTNKAAEDFHPQWWQEEELYPQLEDAYFHGSTALAEALGFTPEDALLPTAIDADVLKALQEEVLRNLVKPGGRQKAREQLNQGKGLDTEIPRRLDGRLDDIVSGGCGFTRESAWIIDEEDYGKCLFDSSQLIFNAFSPVFKATHQIKLTGRKRYLVFSLTLIREGRKYEIIQWCDITALGKVYAEERRNEAQKELHQRAMTIHNALFSIEDEDSAEEQADIIEDEYDEIRELGRICEERRSLWDYLMDQLTLPQRERLAGIIKHLRFAACYDSEELDEAVKALHFPIYH